MENSGLRENLERASEVLLVNIVKFDCLVVHGHAKLCRWGRRGGQRPRTVWLKYAGTLG